MNMKSLKDTIEGLRCCGAERDCDSCPYQGVRYCEDAVKDDAFEWLGEYDRAYGK